MLLLLLICTLLLFLLLWHTVKMRLASLATTFSNNVLDETKAFSLTVTDASKLEGVPDSAKSMWANAHLQAEKTEDAVMDPAKGPWRITLDMPSYIAVLSHVPDRDLRQQVYMANIQRASEKNPDKNNVPLIYETLQLKHEMAQMLGFHNYAELSLSKKMAPSIDAVARTVRSDSRQGSAGRREGTRRDYGTRQGKGR